MYKSKWNQIYPCGIYERTILNTWEPTWNRWAWHPLLWRPQGIDSNLYGNSKEIRTESKIQIYRKSIRFHMEINKAIDWNPYWIYKESNINHVECIRIHMGSMGKPYGKYGIHWGSQQISLGIYWFHLIPIWWCGVY